MKTKIFIMTATIAVLSFSSCTKVATLEQTSIDLADDDAVAEAVFEDIFNSVDNACIILDDMLKGGDTKSITVPGDSCPSITVSHPAEGIWPKVITIDYGTGCTGFFEQKRSGKIIIQVTGFRRETGSQRCVTFEDYFFNGIKVEGVKEFENMGSNTNQNVVFSVNLSNGKLTLPDGKVIERSFQHLREWTAGYMTRNIWDDECLITGDANGVNINGFTYTNTIMTALHWKRACRFIVSGVVKIEREGTEPFELDYGTGECDSNATVSRGSESREIQLRHRHRFMMP